MADFVKFQGNREILVDGGDSRSFERRFSIERNHHASVTADLQPHKARNLEGVSKLLQDLNEIPKSEMYGEVRANRLDAEDTAVLIEAYVSSVRDLFATQE